MFESVLNFLAVAFSIVSLCGVIADCVIRIRGVHNWSFYSKFTAALGVVYAVSFVVVLLMLSYFVVGLVEGRNVVVGWRDYVYPSLLAVGALLWGLNVARSVDVYRLASSRSKL